MLRQVRAPDAGGGAGAIPGFVCRADSAVSLPSQVYRRRHGIGKCSTAGDEVCKIYSSTASNCESCTNLSVLCSSGRTVAQENRVCQRTELFGKHKSYRGAAIYCTAQPGLRQIRRRVGCVCYPITHSEMIKLVDSSFCRTVTTRSTSGVFWIDAAGGASDACPLRVVGDGDWEGRK